MTTREGVTAKVAVVVVWVAMVREELTESGHDTATVEVVEGRVEHTADVGGGKKIPSGTTRPSPGNVLSAVE